MESERESKGYCGCAFRGMLVARGICLRARELRIIEMSRGIRGPPRRGASINRAHFALLHRMTILQSYRLSHEMLRRVVDANIQAGQKSS